MESRGRGDEGKRGKTLFIDRNFPPRPQQRATLSCEKQLEINAQDRFMELRQMLQKMCASLKSSSVSTTIKTLHRST